MKKTSVILALVLALGCFAGCQSENSAAPELLEPVGVRMDTAEVQYGDIYTIKVFGGSVVPYVEDLDFQVDGYLGEVLVNIGDTVEAGQPLVRLDYDSFTFCSSLSGVGREGALCYAPASEQGAAEGRYPSGHH